MEAQAEAFHFGNLAFTRSELRQYARSNVYPNTLARDFCTGFDSFQHLSDREMQTAIDNTLKGKFPFDEFSWSRVKARLGEDKENAPVKINPLIHTRRNFGLYLLGSLSMGAVGGYMSHVIMKYMPDVMDSADKRVRIALTDAGVGLRVADAISRRVSSIILPTIFGYCMVEDHVLSHLEKKTMLDNFCEAFDGLVVARLLREAAQAKDTALTK